MNVYEKHLPKVKCPICGTIFDYTCDEMNHTQGHRHQYAYLICPSCKGRVFPTLNDCDVKKPILGRLSRVFKRRIPCMFVAKINTYGSEFDIKIPGNEINEVLFGNKSKIDAVVVCPERPDWGEYNVQCDADVVNDPMDNTKKVSMDFDELQDKITDWAEESESEDWATPYHVLTKEVAEKYNGKCFVDYEMPERIEGYRFYMDETGLNMQSVGCGPNVNYDHTYHDELGVKSIESYCLAYINTIEMCKDLLAEISNETFEKMQAIVARVRQKNKEVEEAIEKHKEELGIYKNR